MKKCPFCFSENGHAFGCKALGLTDAETVVHPPTQTGAQGEALLLATRIVDMLKANGHCARSFKIKLVTKRLEKAFASRSVPAAGALKQEEEECPRCFGHGLLLDNETECPVCDGKGFMGKEPHKTDPAFTQKGAQGEALLPCPFCGGSGRLFEIDDDEPLNVGGWAVECEMCQASTRVHFPEKDDARPHIVDAWNKREAPSVVDGGTSSASGVSSKEAEIARLRTAIEAAIHDPRGYCEVLRVALQQQVPSHEDVTP